MDNQWWILPQMNQTIVRARERTHTFMTMCSNYLPPDSEEAELSKEMFEIATKLFILINKRIAFEEDASYKGGAFNG